MKYLILSSIILIAVILSSCYYDNEEALYPPYNQACDTANVTFSGSIVPVLSNNCWGCHSNVNAPTFGNNIMLENYADVVARIDQIIPAIKHTATPSPMPKNGNKLSDCDIAKFDIWLRNGTPAK